MADLYGLLGDKDQAFALLEKAYNERDNMVVLLKVDPYFDPLRSDPRFTDLVRRVGFPECVRLSLQDWYGVLHYPERKNTKNAN